MENLRAPKGISLLVAPTYCTYIKPAVVGGIAAAAAADTQDTSCGLQCGNRWRNNNNNIDTLVLFTRHTTTHSTYNLTYH